MLPEIRQSLGLTKKEIWTSSIVGVGGTIAIRFVLGPLCDKYGSRVLFAAVLCIASIPTAMTGLVNSAGGLVVLRLCIGMAGGTFVMCQYWTSRMFSLEVVGTANALVGGWGNLGASVTHLFVGAVLVPMFKSLTKDAEDLDSWRFVSIVPAFVAVFSAAFTYYYSDDCPKGNYWELKKNGAMEEVSAIESFRQGMTDWNTWILFVQYACCFGVELTMNNATCKKIRGSVNVGSLTRLSTIPCSLVLCFRVWTEHGDGSCHCLHFRLVKSVCKRCGRVHQRLVQRQMGNGWSNLGSDCPAFM